jgi:hypothetical protein
MYRVAAVRRVGGLVFGKVQGGERRRLRIIVTYPPDGM